MLNSKEIIHIVPEFYPQKGGVAAFAFQLYHELKSFYVCQKVWVISKNITEVEFNDECVKMISYHEANILLSQLIEKNNKEHTIDFLCHYVPHGFQKRGVPFQLLSLLKKINTTFSFKIIFHELYAVSNNPFTSTFWTSWLQRSITKKIAELADGLYTTTPVYASQISNWLDRTVEYFPVFSNIKNIQQFNDDKRENVIVVFGGKGLKQQLSDYIKKHYQDIEFLLHYKWIDIGNKLESDLLINIDYKGYLEENKISKIFNTVKFGFLNYQNMPLEKSGVFAAYAAHGILPIVVNYTSEYYLDGVDFIDLKNFNKIDMIDTSVITRNLYDKYKNKGAIENHIHYLQKLLVK